MTDRVLAGPALKRAERTSVRLSTDRPVTVEPLLSGSNLPLLVRALRPDLDLAAWAEDNRSLVCPYCFFGGPDKHPHQLVDATTDLTGAIGKVIKP